MMVYVLLGVSERFEARLEEGVEGAKAEDNHSGEE